MAKREAPPNPRRHDALIERLEGAIADLRKGSTIEEVETKYRIPLRQGRSRQGDPGAPRPEDVDRIERENARLKKLVADMALIIEAFRADPGAS